MANTFTTSYPVVFGNLRGFVGLMDFTTDNTTAVPTGLSYVYSISATPKSCNTNGGGFTINTTNNGSVLAPSCTAGDNFHVIVLGR